MIFKMKIGILTQPLLNNYGGLLQNYALQQVLKGMGHEVETIDWRMYKTGRLVEWLYRKKKYIYSYFSNKWEKPRYVVNDKELAIISTNTGFFVKKYISVCPILASTPSKMRQVANSQGYDAYIVGSDQVWRPGFNSMPMAMYLDFCVKDKVKRIAYAASFGTSEWEYNKRMTQNCKKLANLFDAISVREKSGVELCHKYLNVVASQVLDPTLLLNRSYYENLVYNEIEPQNEGALLFNYILDPTEKKDEIIKTISKDQGLVAFSVMPKCQEGNRTKWDIKHRINECIYPSVTSWLRAFMDARMTIVDSFHGVVFSIIFNKPFWVIANSVRGNTRFESILQLFELEDRLVSYDHISKIDWNRPINWDKVNKIRDKEVDRSMLFLKNAL